MMRMTMRLVVMGVLSVAVVAPVAAGGFCADIHVVPVMGAPAEARGEEGDRVQRDGSEGFSASEVLDLRLEVRLKGEIPPTALLGLELVSPNRHVYQRQFVPITTQVRSEAAAVRVDGYPFPLDVQRLSRGPATDSYQGAHFTGAQFTLPVAGSAITASGLYGRWRVNVTLDGEAMACKKLLGFTIVP